MFCIPRANRPCCRLEIALSLSENLGRCWNACLLSSLASTSMVTPSLADSPLQGSYWTLASWGFLHLASLYTSPDLLSSLSPPLLPPFMAVTAFLPKAAIPNPHMQNVKALLVVATNKITLRFHPPASLAMSALLLDLFFLDPGS